MLIKHSRRKQSVKIMDPDCAICSQPALAQCECEAKGLDIAVRQAEQRMMTSVFNDIRAWVRGHAQDYILSYFSMLTARRKDLHASTIHRVTERAAYYYRARPHPSEIAAADLELKRGIDEDWKASVQRYPEVLEYFYGLVDLNLPGDDDPGVRDPPMSALGGVGMGRERGRKVRLREPSEIEERRTEDRRRRRRSRGERDGLMESRERVMRVPAPPTAIGERDGGRARPGPIYAPPHVAGYGYV
ncbi:hypothetical protein MBM_01717 [Drepanopeziza brunnea f. sp. 'multigermtubi' MB_m1]|uniref:Serine/threonine protein phosphatase n=1 Tax=Marssonina brunnea f. sp. multigermtubi (strain MB_m1) TaxID=1072389 RepID=K1WQ69_MARBU|nr:uncharacterized protein MBM_01717 [Drepanopeziza brunnea f. sp. 'multigermtubi' MB_m1]EKD19765.1 hypothetical protein MBM_01717 [Drepanopeziza brunnea f. sp. 'multigermtubi' MB_m1]